VLVLNADATVSPSLLVDALPAFHQTDVAAVQPKVLSPFQGPRARVDSAGLVAHRSRKFTTRGHGLDDDGRFSSPEEIFGADGAAALYRRTALDDVAVPFSAFSAFSADSERDRTGCEYFDESFFAYKEDVDLAWRLQWRGWRTVFVPEAIAFHHRTARTSAEPSPRQAIRERLRMTRTVRSWGFANQRLMQIKNDDGRVLARDLVPWLGREITAWVFALVTDPRLALATWRIAKLTPQAVKKRRWIKRHRAAGADPYRWFV
jgi:GT2 family glycosyltransferase